MHDAAEQLVGTGPSVWLGDAHGTRTFAGCYRVLSQMTLALTEHLRVAEESEQSGATTDGSFLPSQVKCRLHFTEDFHVI